MRLKLFSPVFIAFGLLVALMALPMRSRAAVTVGTVSGTVTYNGSQDTNHEVIVGAHPSLNEGPVDSVHILGLGASLYSPSCKLPLLWAKFR